MIYQLTKNFVTMTHFIKLTVNAIRGEQVCNASEIASIANLGYSLKMSEKTNEFFNGNQVSKVVAIFKTKAKC